MTIVAPAGALAAHSPCREGDAPVPKTPLWDSEQLTQRIRDELPRLSRQLEAIGLYVLQHADYIAAERIQDVAQRCGTQPSAVVRFAKRFGFSGFHELRQAFADDLRRSQPGQRHAYRARVRPLLNRQLVASSACADIAYACMDGACSGVHRLQRSVRAEDVQQAIARLADAQVLWIVGARRAFPVAAYLAYALQGLSKPVQLISFAGALHEGQLRGLRPGDVLLAISFAPYAEETLNSVHTAQAVGASVIAITDDSGSPLVAESDVSLLAPEVTTFGFRALTNAMTLVQSLFVALAFHLEAQGGRSPTNP